jgi:hypothetical protein
MTAKSKTTAAKQQGSPQKPQQQPKDGKLGETELLHYEPEFSLSDAKWLLLGRWHVQVYLAKNRGDFIYM